MGGGATTWDLELNVVQQPPTSILVSPLLSGHPKIVVCGAGKPLSVGGLHHMPAHLESFFFHRSMSQPDLRLTLGHAESKACQACRLVAGVPTF